MLVQCQSLGQKKAEEATYTLAQLNQAVKELASFPETRHASVAFYLAPAEGGAPLATYQPDLSLAPASVMKLFTTGAVLNTLGADFKFETVVEYSGTLDKAGTLRGNLYLRGGGDPAFGAENPDQTMRDLAQAVAKAGIKVVEGAVIGDGSLFEYDNTPGSWSWVDLGNYYGTGASGLAFRHNQYELLFNSGAKEGDPTQLLGLEPNLPGLTHVNEVRTGAPDTGDEAYVYGAPYSYARYVRGTLPPNEKKFKVKGSLPDPELLAAQWLSQALKNQGIKVSQPANAQRLLLAKGQRAELQRRRVTSVASPPLRDLLKTTNVRSFNLYADNFFKFLGYKKFGYGNTHNASKALVEYWQAQGLNLEGFLMEDGSGLSRFNLATARQVGQVLHRMKRSPLFSDFYFSLPVAGKSGTVTHFAKGTPAENKVRLKSGYLTRVKSYAGYSNLPTGKALAFVLMVNNYTGEDRLMGQRLAKVVGMVAGLDLAKR